MSATSPFAPFGRGAGLVGGRLVRRYQRFLADVELASGEVLTVHCPNSGSMLGCAVPGSEVRISFQGTEHRRLAYTLELVRIGRTWVAVNTMRPNQATEHFVAAGAIPELTGYQHRRREVRYGEASRIDLLLWDGGEDDWRGQAKRKCFVEVKNVTLREGAHACFPDAVTERGLKHLHELAGEVRRGHRSVMLFFVARADCDRFRAAHEIHPTYAGALARVAGAGVEILPYRFRVTPRGFVLDRLLPADL